MTIKGTASIKQYHVLNDKRYIVTKDSEENVCVWDVLQARIVESLGKENYENVVKVRQRFISIPNWFTIDLKLGVMTINLDESDCLSAWINFKDMDHNHIKQSQIIDLNDAKINYGCIFLESLFKNCLYLNPKQVQICQTLIHSNSSSTNSTSNTNANEINGNKQENNSTTNKIDADIEANRSGLLRFNIPEHIPVLISEVAGRIIHRFELRELSEDSETLNNSIPSWVVDAISGVLFYSFIYFFLGIQIIFIYFQENQATIRSLYICFASL
jgi:WD repeat-containing protein 48